MNQLEKGIVDGLNSFNSLEPANLTYANGKPLAYRYEYKKLLSDYSDIQEYRAFLLSCMNGYDSDSFAIGGETDSAMFEEYFALKASSADSASAIAKPLFLKT